ncbi:ExeM/NucH family extracellular endonuclease [Dyadobacter psychrotolerans]|uniref:ExeM/NucH family extracellular endonuclease n=1 Tax=Dyadobacter psychrotolerans TaxID=2541721 RepID=A0A4R5DSX3_9BACT|nr:ExeM/NucH family extracellular endonuclease [Dyadobacter psychrotolerans]TDE17469.1 ExeM/NucH family extracellular endonuclease [Dyadobacter psychrotolerans]
MKQKLLFLCVGLLGLCHAPIQVRAQTADHVVISEVYGGGGNGGAPFKNDFIELYNPTSTAISLNNWSVQFTSAAGTSWAPVALSGEIKAKGYYLIQQAAGAGTTMASLPTPDATGTSMMGAGSGKVILCQCTAALSGAKPTGTTIIDFVGYGSTVSYEGTGPTGTPANATSVERKVSATSTAALLGPSGSDYLKGNGWDSNDNGQDFVVQTAVNPQNSTSNREPSDGLFSGSAALDFANQYVNLNSGVKPLILTYNNLTNEDVTISTASPFSISKTAAGAFGTSLTFTQSELPTTSTNFTVYVVVNPSAIGAVNGLLSFSGGGSTPGSVTLSANGVTAFPTTKISAIQGTGSMATSGSFTVEAIVTGVYGTLDPPGFYIQEEDADWDGDLNTSEGIFVSQANPTVAIGDKVLVTGTVDESNTSPSFNQAAIIAPAISIISSGNPAPSFSSIDNANYSIAAAEKYEAMRVQFTSDLVVSDNFSLAQYGELGLSMSGSVYTATQIVDPNDNPETGTNFETSPGNSNAAAVTAYETANANKVIVLDDGSGLSNPSPTPYLDPVLKTIRINSSISSLKGIMGYGFLKYRIQPLPGGDAPVVVSAPRPTVPTFTNATIKLASFNVLNYFNGNGSGGGFPTSRGATTAAAFAIQRSKIIEAISQINADVVGLLEIENDGVGTLSAIQDLVNGLNAKMGANTYSIVKDGSSIQTGNTDEIKCAIIYKNATIFPEGAAALTGVTGQRPFLAQTFTTTASEKFNFIVNHFKSKGSGGTGADADNGDGQGFYNATRKAQASALVTFINALVTTSGSDRIVSVGDYNAYFEEDPLDLLRASGLVVASTSTAHSYLFNGALGSLDHAVISSSMTDKVAVQKWNINSNEPTLLQYTNTTYTDASSPFRSSDHDPILIGVNFSGALPVNLISFTAKEVNKQIQLNWKTASEINNSHFTVQRSADAVSFEDLAVIDGAGNTSTVKTYSFLDAAPLEGLSYYRLKQLDLDGTTTNSRVVTVKLNGEADRELTVYPNPVTDHVTLKLAGRMATAKSLKYEILSQDGVKLLSGKGSLSEINKSADRALPNIKSGIYLIRISGADETHVFRFVKQ